MSIFNDNRRYSDEPEVYEEWKREVIWECRRDNVEPEYDDYEEGDEEWEG